MPSLALAEHVEACGVPFDKLRERLSGAPFDRLRARLFITAIRSLRFGHVVQPLVNSSKAPNAGPIVAPGPKPTLVRFE